MASLVVRRHFSLKVVVACRDFVSTHVKSSTDRTRKGKQFLSFSFFVPVPTSAGINSESDEPDSLETAKDASVPVRQASVAGTLRSVRGGVTKTETSPSEADLLGLLQLERLAQQATRRDYELLRKQYQRYFSFSSISVGG